MRPHVDTWLNPTTTTTSALTYSGHPNLTLFVLFSLVQVIFSLLAFATFTTIPSTSGMSRFCRITEMSLRDATFSNSRCPPGSKCIIYLAGTNISVSSSGGRCSGRRGEPRDYVCGSSQGDLQRSALVSNQSGACKRLATLLQERGEGQRRRKTIFRHGRMVINTHLGHLCLVFWVAFLFENTQPLIGQRLA